MPLKRKTFVMSMGKAKADFEKFAYEKLKEGKAPIPDVKKLSQQKGVRLSSKGIIVDSTRAHRDIVDFLRFSGAVFVHPSSIQRLNAERLSLVKQLSDLGYRVAVPRLSMNSSKVLQKASKNGARLFPADPPVIGEHNGKKELTSAISWLRDMWIHDGKKRVMRFNKNKEVNVAGEGGMVLGFGENKYLVSDKLRNNPLVIKMARKGARFYFLKDGENFYPNLSKIIGKKLYVTINHVDLFVGIAGKIMLVEEDYYHQNQGVLREAARENKLKIVFIPKEEQDFHPANFLVLGENKILMDKQAQRTIDVLKKNGVDVISTRVPMRANIAAGGGVHCIVNEL